MKIGFDAKRYFQNKTGLGSYSKTLINGFIEQYPDHEYFLYTSHKPRHEDLKQLLDQSKIKIRYPKNINGTYWRSRGILRDLKQDNIQVYHGLSNELPFGIHKTEIKTVVTIHDLLFKDFPQDYTLIDRMIYDWKSKYACQKADKVVAISIASKKSISKHYGIPNDTISVIHQGINPAFYDLQSKITQDKILVELGIYFEYFLFVGNSSSRKNLSTVLKSLKHNQEKRQLILVLYGTELSKEYKALVKEYNLDQQIHIYSNISIAFLMTLYTNAKCLVYPSLGEGWGLPVEEAIVCNSYVIVPNYEPFTEKRSIQKRFLKNPESPTELAKVVDDIWKLKQNSVQKALENEPKLEKWQSLYTELTDHF